MKLNKNLITILAISTLCVGCNKTTNYTYDSHIEIEFTNSKAFISSPDVFTQRL